MTNHDYYVNHVLPQLELDVSEKYPRITLDRQENYHPLNHHSVLMLVALTGTGKTTTFDELQHLVGDQLTDAMMIIPSRREIADWIAIPMAQVMLGEPTHNVKDRVKRFHYTRTFAEQVAGGMATAFSWVYVHDDYEGLILSEGIRGANELTYALSHCPSWHIVELSLDPLIRLQRLSSRNSTFDKADGVGDVSFLPEEIRTEASQLLQSGHITEKALTIMQAESESYGLYPFADGDQYTNYHCVAVDDRTPEQVATEVYKIIQGIHHAND